MRVRPLQDTRGCEQLLRIEDDSIGLVAFLAVHSTRRGPAFGGIRRRVFSSEAAAIDEVVELAGAMSDKCALAGLAAGGAKTVIMGHDALEVADAYRRVGEVVRSLDGRYVCGPDVGTGDDQLGHVREVTDRVNPEGNDAGRSTALGVLAGLRGVLRALGGTPSYGGLRYVVQGLGAVGFAVAEVLLEDGGVVLGSDPAANARGRARERGVELVGLDEPPDIACDVWMPCALGHVLTEAVARSTPCRAICGSANNQLDAAAAADVLNARAILHAPDVVVSAGAVIEGVLSVLGPDDPDLRERIAKTINGIEGTVQTVLAAAGPRRSPSAVARELARERIGR